MDMKEALSGIYDNVSNWVSENPMQAALMVGSTMPFIGDAAGFGGDLYNMYKNPEERTWENAGWALAGALPFVPSGLGTIKNVGGDAADEVARLLREGRSSDVTDKLFSEADPKKLDELYESGQTGMDMPLDEASKESRRLYDMKMRGEGLHGTSGNWTEFRRDQPYHYLTEGTGEDQQKFAQAFARNRAENVGGEPRVMDIVYDDRDVLDTRKPFDNATVKAMLNEREDIARYGADEYMQRKFNDGLPGWGDEPFNQMIADSPYTGIVQNEVRGGINSVAISDPSKMRFKDARFDPRLKHLRNLGASVAGVSVLSPSMINALMGDGNEI